MNIDEQRLLQEVAHLKNILQMKNDRIKDLEEMCELFDLCQKKLHKRIAFRDELIMYLGGNKEFNEAMLSKEGLYLHMDSNHRAN